MLQILRRHCWLLTALFVLHYAAAAPASTILVFGDSISAAYGLRLEEGWVSLLQKKLTAQGYGYRVMNASVSGETTGGGRSRLARALELHKPAIVILELGGNDGLRGLPLAEASSNLNTMIKAALASGAKVVLAGMRIPPNYGPSYTQKFHAMFSELAQQYQLALVPFFLQRVALNESLMQADGIHPNAAGQPLLVETMWPALQPLLKK